MQYDLRPSPKPHNRQTRLWSLVMLLLLGGATIACGLLPDLTGGAGQDDVTEVPTAVIEPTATNTAINNPAIETTTVVDPATGQTAVATVDTAAIAQEVLEQVQADLAAQPSGDTPSVPIQSSGALSVSDLELSLTALYQQVNQAVVYILVPPIGTGSGFVYSADGYIVTNNHVVSGGSDYEIVFANGQRRAAELIGADVDSDLAVLQVTNLPEGVTPLTLADSDALQVGQLAVAIGNPFGEQGSMSLGIISGLGRSLTSQREEQGFITGGYSLPEVIQTDAPINPGNSGGPLLNMAGEVIGVNSAIATVTGTNSGVGFAIPVNAVKRIVPELIANGEYDYSYMGASFASELSLDQMEFLGIEQQGAYVRSVTPGSPADDAGLIGADDQTGSGGDLIVAIDGRPINDFAAMNAYLVFNTSPGQTIQVTVLRNGSETTFPLTLGERP